MAGVRSGTVILVDPDMRDGGVDLDALIGDLRRLGIGRTMLVPGLARHPELLTGAVKACGARGAVVVSAKLGHPPISELRMWGEAGGLAPLGVNVVALDILRARRSAVERSAHAVRMVRSAVLALDAPGAAIRRPVGGALSRRALLNGRATTWVPVVEVKASSCLGTSRCGHCVEACLEGALRLGDGVAGVPPTVEVSRCEACSGCLDVCPTGALSLDGHDPGTLARRLQALLRGSDGSAAPTLAIACQTAVGPLHHLGERGDGLSGWLVLEVACLGGVGSAWQLAALAAGARTVQLMPCERCMDRGSVTKAVDFTRSLLAALGDGDAARRVGVLPSGGASLKRAIHAANGLNARLDGHGADRMPVLSSPETSARVAAWAIDELHRALPVTAEDGQPTLRVIVGEGSPLGEPRVGKGCTGCGVCARNCPTGALRLTAGLGSTELVLDPGACTGCEACVETCPEDVIKVIRGVDLDLLARGRVSIARVEAVACADCGENVPPLPATAHVTSLPARFAGRCPRCRQTALVASA